MFIGLMDELSKGTFLPQETNLAQLVEEREQIAVETSKLHQQKKDKEIEEKETKKRQQKEELKIHQQREKELQRY